jgi:hypothetical protein
VCLPAFLYLSTFVYKVFTYESILGKERQFEFVNITQFDEATGSTFQQSETVKIVQVNHGIKLIEADT